MAGSLISGRVSDYHRSRLVKAYPDQTPHPERRLHLQIPGILVAMSGILMYGWFIYFHIHVAGVIVSTAIGKRLPMTFIMVSRLKLLFHSGVWYDLGFHHHDKLLDRELQGDPSNTGGFGKLVPQPGGRCFRCSD